MPGYIFQRLLVAAALAGALIPVAALAQNDESQSVAEAARRARDQKKSGKSARVVNDDNLKPAFSASPSGAAPDAAAVTPAPGEAAQPAMSCVASEEPRPALPPGMSPDALPEPPRTPSLKCTPVGSSPDASTQASADSGSGSSASSSTGSPAGQGSGNAGQDQKAAGEVAKLADELKEAQKQLDLLQRELSLEQDSYFSKPDHVRDTAGKSKIDTIQQSVGAKQQEVERLKERLAALKGAQGTSNPAPAQP